MRFHNAIMLWRWRIGALTLFVACILIAAFIGACQGLGSFGAPAERTESREKSTDEEAEPPKTETQASAYIGVSGGIVSFQGCKLAVPKGVLRDNEFFTVRYPDEQDERVVNGTHYLVLPFGKTFVRASVVEIQYDPKNIPDGVAQNDLTIAYLLDNAWRELGKSSVDIDNHTVSAPVTSLGEFAVVPKSTSLIKANKSPEVVIETAEVPLDDGRLRINYDAGKSTDPDGKAIRFEWDFDGDGLFDYIGREDATASYVFPSIGKYTTILRVTDNNREPASSIGTVVVEADRLFPPDPPSKLDMTITALPPSARVPVTVQYAASVKGGLPPYIIHWSFGGGDTSDQFNPATRYKKSGVEKVFVEVGDYSGQEIARQVTLTLSGIEKPEGTHRPFKLTLLESCKEGRAPLDVEFTLKLENGVDPVKWQVLYGDEAGDAHPKKGEGRKFKHTYKEPGLYLVEIIATDGDKRADSAFATIRVDAAIAPQSGGQGESGEGVEMPGASVASAAELFTARERTIGITAGQSASDPKSYAFAVQGLAPDTVTNVKWDFGDGFFSEEQSPAHEFLGEGVFEVALTFSSRGEKFTRMLWLPVSQSAMAAVQLPAEIDGLAPFKVRANALIAGIEGAPQFAWDFGNGDTSAEQSPQYVYKEAGEHEIKLTVTDADGKTKAESKPIKVKVLPQATFYKEPIAFVQAEAGGTRRMVVADKGGGGSYSLPGAIDAGSTPRFSAGAGYIGYVESGAFVVKETLSGCNAFRFEPADGAVESGIVSSFGDLMFINVAKDDGRVVAYRYSATGGLTSVTPDGENARVAAIADNGSSFLLIHWKDDAVNVLSQITYDDEKDAWGEPVKIAEDVKEASANSDCLVVLALKNNRSVYEYSASEPDGGEVSGTAREKRGLAMSSDGDTAAWMENAGKAEWEIIVARRSEDGHLEMANLSAMLGISCDAMRLALDGAYIVIYSLYGLASDEATAVDLSGDSDGVADDAGEPGAQAGDGAEGSAGQAGYFLIDLSVEPPTVKFLFAGSPAFDLGFSLRKE